MIVWIANWLAKPRRWAVYLVAANFAVWGALGILVFAVWLAVK